MGDNLENYDKIKVIGHGSYGEVWLVKHKNDKKEYVLKKLDLRNASTKERRGAEQECRLLSQLKHPNIVTYKESFETCEGFLYISMRFCEAGDLYTKLKQQKGKLLEEKQIVEWFIQIAMALRYMHSQNIMHRDLKTQNIFLTKNRIIKVGDLGIARVLDSSGDMAKTLIGTPYYMSPEIFSNKPYNFKSDVWALGCCVFEMVTLKHAFNGKDLNSLMYQIQRGRLPPMPEVYSVQLKTLIKAMMQRVPERRPSVDRVIKDSFIQKHIAIFLKETRKSQASKPGQDKDEPGRRVKPRPSNSKVERRRSSDEVLKPLKCPPELEVIPEECGVQASSLLSSLVNKNGDGDVGGRVDGDRKAKELEAVEDHHHHHQQQVHQDHHHNDEEGAGDGKPHQVISHSKSDPSLARQNRRLGVQKPSKVLTEGPQAKEVVTVAPNPSLESQDIQRSLPSKSSSSSKSRPTSSKGSRPLPALGSHSPNRGVPAPIKSSSDPVRHDENPGRNFPSSSSASSSSSSLSSSSSVSVSADVERSKPKNDFSVSSVADDEEVMDSTRPDTSRSGARERRRLRVMNENLVNIDITKSKLLMSASNENDQIRKSVDKSMSSSTSASSSSSFERRKSDPDTKPTSSNPTSGLTKCSRQERPLSTDGKRLKDRKKVTGFGKGGGDDDDDESNTSPESGTPEEIDEEESDMKSDRKEMKKFIYLLGTLTLRRKNDDDDHAGDDDNDGGDEEEDDENTSLKNVKQGSEEQPPSLRNAVAPVGRIQQLQQQLQQQQQVSAEINKDCDLTSTGVLYNRISSLRRDCVRGIGVLRLRRAYEILDKFDEEELGPPLVNLLGQSDYDNYAGKIMQLKYYEDTVNGDRR